ncbi:transposable element Tcb2 transposase [Trichonephila clavipes]|nr:transposable element Tcb2 transposase [Trichonephila clavipes]
MFGSIGLINIERYRDRTTNLLIKDEVEKLAYQLNEEAEWTERPIRRLSKMMYGSTCADMQLDVMGECLSSIKHVVGARRNRRQTAGEIVRHTTQATGRPISRFTVARRLHGGGLFARRPVRCVPLTPANRRRRSLWCREHRNWRDNEWGRVLFTDESRFSLSSDSHRILIWRERGSRNHPSNIIERDRYGGHGVLVWGGIMLCSRTDLHIFDAGSVNGTRYCNEILLPYVRLFRGAMGLQFLFMDDKAPCHRTVAAKQLLESEDIERMDWPARSPDLNPIEHVWDFLGRRLAARTLPPVTIRELRLALQDEWAAMPQQLIDTLILSMGRNETWHMARCETCLAVRGDCIPYFRPDVSCWTPITGMFRPSVALRSMLLFSIKLLFISLISLLAYVTPEKFLEYERHVLYRMIRIGFNDKLKDKSQGHMQKHLNTKCTAYFRDVNLIYDDDPEDCFRLDFCPIRK